MKKLMFAAAAALCATAGFCVESANIVGYATNDLRYGRKAVGAQFAAVSGSTIDLTDIKVTGYDAESGTEGDVNVQILDAYGKAGMTYFYYDVPGELTGWIDGNDEEVEVGAVVVGPGEGLWVRSPNTSYSLVIPGVTL